MGDASQRTAAEERTPRAAVDPGRITDVHCHVGLLGDARAVPALRQALYGMDDPKQGRPYVEALAKLGGQEAIASLAGYCSRDGYESTLPVIREIRDSDRMEGVDRIWLPGEMEFYTVRDRLEKGIPVNPALVAQLRQLAKELQVSDRLE